MRSTSVEALDAVRRRITVEVSEDEVCSEIEKQFSQISRAAKVPGFRPGKAPRSVLEKYFGVELRGEVQKRLVQSAIDDAVRTHGLDPVSSAQIETTEAVGLGKSLRFSATLEVMPDIELQTYRGLEGERVLEIVDDDAVNTALQRIRNSFAQLVPVDDRTEAKDADIATIEYDVRVADRLVGRRHDRRIEIDSNAAQDQISSRIIGMEINSERTFEIDFPEGHSESELAGQRAIFTVKLKELAVRDVPILDDEFARDHGEFDSLAELRQKIRERLEFEANRSADQRLRDGLLARLVEMHQVAIPGSLLLRQQERIVQQQLSHLTQINPRAEVTEELVSKLLGESEGDARRQVAGRLILDAIAKLENLEVAEDDLELNLREMQKHAARDGSPAKAREYFSDLGVRENVRRALRQDLALDLVANFAQIRTIEKKSDVAEPA